MFLFYIHVKQYFACICSRYVHGTNEVGFLEQTGAGCWCLHPRGLALIYRVSHSVSVSQTTPELNREPAVLPGRY